MKTRRDAQFRGLWIFLVADSLTSVARGEIEPRADNPSEAVFYAH